MSASPLGRVPDLLLGVADVEVADEEGGVGALQHRLDLLAHVAEVHRGLRSDCALDRQSKSSFIISSD